MVCCFHTVTEVWQVLQGRLPGRTAREQVTVFDSVGFALEDYSALRFMRDCARRLGVGQSLSLIPELADPKDLFASIRPLPQANAPNILVTAAKPSATAMARA